MIVVTDPEALATLRASFQDLFERVDGDGWPIVARALGHGVHIASFTAGEGEEHVVGFYEPDSKRLLINEASIHALQSDDATMDDVYDLLETVVHEAQHAINDHEGKVIPPRVALLEGPDLYERNSRWDEALAHAQSFLFLSKAGQDALVRESTTLGQLFEGVTYDPAQDNALEYYADIAYTQLKTKPTFYRDYLPQAFGNHAAEADRIASRGHDAWRQRIQTGDEAAPAKPAQR